MEDNQIEIEEDIVKSETDGYITDPFSTKDIKISNAVISLSSLINRLKYSEVDLNPDFQRHANLWSPTNMSRLIESILLKLPLPIFYFDVSDPDRWIVVDGLQRLSTIKKFVVDKKLKLKNLEFLKELDGKSYDDLERNLKRIIDETQIVTYQIEAQTPKKVRYSIFNRINTGGLSLNAQEIRQALNQKGNGITFLGECSEEEVFKRVVSVPSKRMLDRELILRFVAFKLTSSASENFPFSNMGEFLDDSMEKLDSIDEGRLTELRESLLATLEFSEKVLGENHHFSRAIADDRRTNTLNRSLFDVITVCFSEISDKTIFWNQKKIFKDKLITLMKDEQSEFFKSITEGTSSKGAIETRFRIMNQLIKEVIDED
ncbi:DUF262 domain-containing protein [Sulfurimonas hydrogeniphila]|uniref:DUF262 domain-containing protein n=1 Tax=Sulfurimonas hydrogeniphila TaxID=2509341 RepID=UPI00125F41DC|nr:DUF262 domain-containing protein [Sulfurimonas hydrogeniphila]